MGSSRDLQLDGLKFFLIYLVVLGHLTFNDYGIGVKRLFYSFHMPVFVFLSGYFTSLTSNKDKRIKWIKQTIIILFLAHTAQYLLLILMGLTSSLINDSAFQISSVLNKSILINPAFTLWYLVSLIYWRTTIWMINGKVSDSLLFAISFIFAILAGFVPLNNEFSFQRTFSFAPFFFMGIIFKKKNMINDLKKMPILYAFIGIIVGLFLARGMATYYPINHYTNWGEAIQRIKQTLLALFLCPLVVRAFSCKFSEYFAKYGSRTLWIYIGHSLLIILGRRIAHHFGWSMNLISALFVAAIICTIIIIIADGFTIIKHNKAVQVSQ